MLIYQSQLENANRKKNLEVPDCSNYHITLQEKSNQRLSEQEI